MIISYVSFKASGNWCFLVLNNVRNIAGEKVLASKNLLIESICLIEYN